jgi:hypothetical protein
MAKQEFRADCWRGRNGDFLVDGMMGPRRRLPFSALDQWSTSNEDTLYGMKSDCINECQHSPPELFSTEFAYVLSQTASVF